MKEPILQLLIDPASKAPLSLSVASRNDVGEIMDGKLTSPSGASYPIVNGIPRFVLTQDAGQLQTGRSFDYQWRQSAAWDMPAVREFGREWLLQRYGFTTVGEMRRYFAQGGRVLDAGCGGGYTASLWLTSTWQKEGSRADYIGADISGAVDVARQRLFEIPNTEFLQGDVLQLPYREETFDIIFSEGVLHHTPSTERALKALVPLLRDGGEIMFYLYRVKGPIREFTDDYIRGIVSALSPEEAMEMLRPLTQFGQSLAELHAEIEVKEDIPYLGIQAGKYDVQRLLYWHFAKMFWNDKLSFDANHLMNFDWYSPSYAFRQSEEEVRRWCAECGLSIFRFNSEESGFTVRAIKD